MAEIKGTIEIDGKVSEFLLDLTNGSYTQWGADLPVMGERVDLLEGLAEEFGEWALENVCRVCHDKMINDGEGEDGKCGNCADAEQGLDDCYRQVKRLIKPHPIPYDVLCQRAPDFTGDEIMAVLRELHREGYAEIDHGFGWRRTDG